MAARDVVEAAVVVVADRPTDLAFHEMHGVKVHSRVCVALDSFRPWNFYAVDKCCWLACLGCCWHGTSLWWYTTTVTGESKSKRVSHSFQRTYTRHTSKPRAVGLCLFSKIAIKTYENMSNIRIVALAGCGHRLGKFIEVLTIEMSDLNRFPFHFSVTITWAVVKHLVKDVTSSMHVGPWNIAK